MKTSDSIRGATLALVIVAFAAIGVSFFSAGRSRSRRHEIVGLKTQVHGLSGVREDLEDSLRQTQRQAQQQAMTAWELQDALIQEQLRAKALADELERQKQIILQNGQPTPIRKPTTNIASSNLADGRKEKSP